MCKEPLLVLKNVQLTLPILFGLKYKYLGFFALSFYLGYSHLHQMTMLQKIPSIDFLKLL